MEIKRIQQDLCGTALGLATSVWKIRFCTLKMYRSNGSPVAMSTPNNGILVLNTTLLLMEPGILATLEWFQNWDGELQDNPG